MAPGDHPSMLTHTSGVPIPSYTGPVWEQYNALADAAAFPARI